MIYSMHGDFMIYTNSLSGVHMCFYTLVLGIFHIHRRLLSVEWIVGEENTSILATGSAIISGLGKRLYIGNVEIIIGQPCQGKMVSFESCMLQHSDVPYSFQEF